MMDPITNEQLDDLDRLYNAATPEEVQITATISGIRLDQKYLTAKWEFREAVHNSYPALRARLTAAEVKIAEYHIPPEEEAAYLEWQAKDGPQCSTFQPPVEGPREPEYRTTVRKWRELVARAESAERERDEARKAQEKWRDQLRRALDKQREYLDQSLQVCEQRDTIAAEAARLREALETSTRFLHAIRYALTDPVFVNDRGTWCVTHPEEDQKAWSRDAAEMQARAALTTPATTKWLASHDAGVKEKVLRELIAQANRERPGLIAAFGDVCPGDILAIAVSWADAAAKEAANVG